eukprot:scaffold567_cov127-Isochrysis_galbana.AAC.6
MDMSAAAPRTTILHSVSQMVTASVDPFMPTAAELADDEPADGVNDIFLLQINRHANIAHRIARRKLQYD